MDIIMQKVKLNKKKKRQKRYGKKRKGGNARKTLLKQKLKNHEG